MVNQSGKTAVRIDLEELRCLVLVLLRVEVLHLVIETEFVQNVRDFPEVEWSEWG